jgi:O-antigen/teichoic acid export membrane protein
MKQVQEKFFTWLDRILRTDTKYIVEGSLWTILGRVSLALFSAITMIAFAKFASQETFGNYQYVITVVGLLSILSLPGMDTALVRSVAMGFDASVHQAHKAKMKWGMLMSMGLFIVAGWYFLHGNNLLGYAFLVAGVFAPLKETYEAYLSFWNGKKQFRTRLVYDVVVTGITAASTLITLMLHAPFLVIMIVFFATRYGAHAIASYFIKKHLENNNQDPHLVEYGKQLTTTNSLTQIIFSIDKLFVWFFLGQFLWRFMCLP